MYTDKFGVYKQAVVDAYLQKQAKGEDDWLNRPTRFRIRRQCCQLVEHNLEKRDERALHRYLEMDPGDNDYLTAIRNTDGDDFKGFEKFLSDQEINTSEENVELLAWLIDFPARPFSKYIEMASNEPILTENEKDGIQKAEDGSTNGMKSTLPDPGGKEKADQQKDTSPKITRTWLIGITAAFIGALIWWFLSRGDGCMYWNNDHYVATSCSIPRLDTPIVTLDRSKLRGFRRIKQVDTLTHYSVGRLWYTRVADSIEVYSAGGTHPLYPDKTLKKVTDYIVNVCHNRKK